MPTKRKTKKAVTPKTSNKKGRKKADYGKPVPSVPLKKGLKKAIPMPEFVKFMQFGNSFEGTVREIKPPHKKGYSESLILETDSGSVLNLPYQTNIKSQFELNGIGIGDYVVITFADVVQMSGGRTLKKFDIQFAKGK